MRRREHLSRGFRNGDVIDGSGVGQPVIAILEGSVIEREEDALVLMVGGVGYRVHVTKALLQGAPEEERLRLFTHLVVREDAQVLYGFATKEERILFVKLQNASGVGPKLALQVLSHFSVDELVRAIAEADVKKLSKVQGVGAKTASRIVLELKGSLENWDLATNASKSGEIGKVGSSRSGPLVDIEEALFQLGFGEREVAPVLAELAPELAVLGVNEGIRRALQALSR